MNRKITKVRYIKTNIGTRGDKTTCYLKFGISLNKIPFGNLLDATDEFHSLLKNFNIETIEYSNDEGNIWYEDLITGEALGYAYRNPEDTNDSELGKKIALTRAQQAAYEAVTVLYDGIQTLFLNLANKYDTLAENTLSAVDSCQEHVNDLIG